MTLSITAAAHYTSTLPPSILLTVASTTSGPNPVVEGAELTVTRIHADGSRHLVLGPPNPRISGGAWSGLDCHSPYNQAVTYEVNAGPTATSGSVSLASAQTWLVHAAMPELSVRIDNVTVIADRAHASRSVRFQPLDSPVIFVTDGRRNGVVGSIECVMPRASVPAMLDLLQDDSVVLVNTPGSIDWDIKWLWCQPGAVVEHTEPGTVKADWRFFKLPFEECAEPDTDSVTLTCAEAATFAATCAAYAALYTSCGRAALDLR